MIKIENVDVCGFEAAIRGMRNPLNSWDKSDSTFIDVFDDRENIRTYYQKSVDIGENDLKLMKQLVKAGTDHSKFMRMITVTCDITAPQFWAAELDTYKIATVRNSCSFQHKGASKPFSIRDFSVQKELYDILAPEKEQRKHFIMYPECLKDDYKIYSCGDRNYKVFKNGKIVSCAYQRKHEADNRTRHFSERVVLPSKTPHGYYIVNIGGRKYTEKWLVHRLVAKVWMDNAYFDGAEINHKDGNKGNNSVDNLEWVTHRENEIHKFKNGLDGRTIHTDYMAWKNAIKFNSYNRQKIKQDYQSGMKQTLIAEKYGISQSLVSQIIRDDFCKNNDLFMLAETWESIIDTLNSFRELYIDTSDYNYFIAIRQLLPMGYNYRFTWQANYAVLRNIYHSRKNHKIDEWRDFCKWVEELPCSELITMEG